MRLRHALDDAFARGSHVRVLRALIELPAGFATSGRELARRAEVSAPTAREALESLVDQGIVNVRRSMTSAAYELNSEHILAPVIRAMFDREGSVHEELERELSAALAKYSSVREAVLFGSAARGDMRPTSDIDVAVRVDHDLPEDDPRLERIRRKYGNRISLTRIPSRAGRGLSERLVSEGKALPITRRKGA